MSGYVSCACRDCFDIAITSAGPALCHACQDAGCTAWAVDTCDECETQEDGETGTTIHCAPCSERSMDYDCQREPEDEED